MPIRLALSHICMQNKGLLLIISGIPSQQSMGIFLVYNLMVFKLTLQSVGVILLKKSFSLRLSDISCSNF